MNVNWQRRVLGLGGVLIAVIAASVLAATGAFAGASRTGPSHPPSQRVVQGSRAPRRSAGRRAGATGDRLAARRTDSRVARGLDRVPASTSCPAHDGFPVPTGVEHGRPDQAKGRLLVPPGARSVLICNYNGSARLPPFEDPLFAAYGLVGRHDVHSEPLTSALVRGMNNIHAHGFVYNCTFDVGNALIVLFRYPGRRDVEYRVGEMGCGQIDSGRVERLGLVGARHTGTKVIARMQKLARPAPYGTVHGTVRLCGGPAPGSCRGGVVTSCQTSGNAHCWRYDRPELLTRAGKVVDRARVVTWNNDIPKWRFSLYAVAGRYRVVMCAVHTRKPHTLRCPHGSGGVAVTLRDNRAVRIKLTFNIM